jgi:hypothetical protein
MTEQNLDGAQVGASFQQVCRPTMTQCVRRAENYTARSTDLGRQE